MHVRSIITAGGVALASAALAGCGSAATSSRPATSRTTSASPSATSSPVVYAWGSFGSDQRAHSKLPRGSGAGSGTGRHRRAGAGRVSRDVRRTPVVVHGIAGTVTQISTSNSDGYALTTSGAVYAWGDGAAGQLGDGSTTARSITAVRVHFPAGVRIASLPNPMPFDGGMAIDSSGHVWGWGNDQNRELCLSRSADLSTPVRLPLAAVTRAVGAQRHALYEERDGHVVSCGFGQFGQLGNATSGTSAQTSGPVAVRGLPHGQIAALTSGFGNAGVLMSDGAYYDWGLNTGGQVGDGSRTNATTAQRVHLPDGVVKVDEGGSVAANGQAMALLSDGELWEWGTGTHGQLGDGATADRDAPIQLREPAGAHFASFSSGGATDFAIDSSGRLYAWGANAQGELGDGSTATRSTTPVRDAITVSQVSSTAGNVAALGRPSS